MCKFCENGARDTPLRGVYIPHFDQISAKLQFCGYYGSYAPIMTDGVKLGVERVQALADISRLVPSSMPNFSAKRRLFKSLRGQF